MTTFVALCVFAHDGWVTCSGHVVLAANRDDVHDCPWRRGRSSCCALRAHVENFTYGVFGFRSSDDGTLPIVRQAVYRLFST